VSGPVLDQINIVVSDMEASVAFYRLLGLEIPDTVPEWQAHHRTASAPGLDLDLDSETFARQWNQGARPARAGSSVIGFRLASREAVDATHAAVVEAGYASQQPPCDTFLGARYAIVEDPDGNPVGLMSPVDPARRTPVRPPP
jgi:catechol 2,3-dioxygenase-like lactoylglutathione lyase family enzyme